MTSIHTDVHGIIDQIENLTDEPFVKKMIGKPPVPVFFVQLLHLMMKAKGVPRQRAQVFCVATTLLQMALNTHECVTNESVVHPDAVRRRQLYVLAGDYCSSLFYQLLAKHEEMEGIHCLAKATCSINETKMTHHLAPSASCLDAAALKRLGHISSGLLTALADFFHVGQDSENIWKRILPGFQLLDTLRYHSSFPHQLDPSGLNLIQVIVQELVTLVNLIDEPDIKMFMQQKLDEQLSFLSELSAVKER